MSDPLLDKLAAVLRQTFAQPDLPVARTTTADDIPGWDSLAHMFLVMEIGSTFAVLLSVDEVAALPNLGALCNLIEARGGATCG